MEDWGEEEWDAVDKSLDRFQAACRSGDRFELAQFVPPPNDPMRKVALVALIKVELERRWRSGISVSVERYLQEWPELSDRETIAELTAADARIRRSCDDWPSSTGSNPDHD